MMFLSSFLFSSCYNMNLKIQILEHVCSGIINIDNMYIYSDDKDIQTAFKNIDKFYIVDTVKEAQIVILNKNTPILKKFPNKHIFVLNYDLLEEIPSSFGAFFWKKGRPNIVFIKSRLNKQSLKLSKELNHYVEEKVW